MHRGLRYASWSLWSLMIAASGQMACTHGDSSSKQDTAEVTADTARPTPTPSVAAKQAEAKVQQAGSTAKTKVKKAVKRTEIAAAKNAANVPGEGSEEEYAADVDAAMGDIASTATSAESQADAGTAVAASAAVNSDADNSKVNRLSDGDVGVSADQQGNSKEDVEITRKIRRSLTKNKNLSVYAHNVKIITREGRVVLKGPVRSENERKIIEDEAVTVAGAGNVTSGIEVKAK